MRLRVQVKIMGQRSSVIYGSVPGDTAAAGQGVALQLTAALCRLFFDRLGNASRPKLLFWSLLFDLYIIAMTPFSLVTGKNAY
jgi:hypothetical protein